jgi:hypothetical protein
MKNEINSITEILCLVMVLVIFGTFVYGLINMFINERKKSKYTSNMKIGDSVYFTSQRHIDCKINNLSPDESNPDLVEVTVLIHKSSLYPND